MMTSEGPLDRIHEILTWIQQGRDATFEGLHRGPLSGLGEAAAEDVLRFLCRGGWLDARLEEIEPRRLTVAYAVVRPRRREVSR